ncbi:integrase/recombinase XerC/integrase/recombinase XerD [Anaerovirgula multivorans]|uniref:Integrase/recombinase XerC/integrase/recombinase XerD n=1 Tax=Anaerovirgula multivorans TaxID=312168 RepID=A0A239B534_9FIRM|nr:tyrosine-type recombinase/integrase [Anaerovirgula multivorans]SNS03045.1 integrase/recombinase XerC/integrase/recombinase XerD [Anaerovirgula multivorans]
MITLDKAIELFNIEQQLKGNSKITIMNYNRMLRYFMDFIGNVLVIDIEISDIKAYQIFLSSKQVDNHFNNNIEKQISKKTIQTYIKHVRVFMNWLYAESYIQEDIGSKIKLPKAPNKVIEILSEDEISILYKAINDNTEFGLRNKCMISLMLDSGLRRDEVLTLGIDNVHFTQNVIKVKGKGEKDRIVPMGLYTKKLLFKYLNGYRPMPDYPTNLIFMSQEKTPVSKDVVKMLFARLKKKTGIKRLGPHLFRHTFATRYLMNGGDSFGLQMILGHSTLEMTRRYSHLASAYTVNNFRSLSTLDKLRGQNVKL